jgi:hypothetical protein
MKKHYVHVRIVVQLARRSSFMCHCIRDGLGAQTALSAEIQSPRSLVKTLAHDGLQRVVQRRSLNAQQHRDATRRTSTLTVRSGYARLRLTKIHFAGDGFQTSIGTAALLHG